jgi:hypothetical protein
MTQDPLNELFKDVKDPDNRAKLFVLFAGAMIMSTILIVLELLYSYPNVTTYNLKRI